MNDLLLTNGRIYTFDATHPQANAIAFAGGRVVAFDAQAQAEPSAQTIDLGGRTLIPGLVDAHIHFTMYAKGLARVQLEGARSLAEAIARVEQRVRASEPGEWIFGWGWNHNDWSVPDFPDKQSLDRVAPQNPVVLERKDGHSTWVNSAALQRAGITRETLDPPGGVIERNATGEPTGLLREQAAWLIESQIGPAASAVSEAELLQAIHNAHALGLTGIHTVEGATALRAFQNLHVQNKLTLRTLHMLPAENLEHAIALGVETGLGDDLLRIGGVKIFADGSLGSQTAHMLEPFEGQPGNCGIVVTPPAEIERLARAAVNANIMVLTHAIGDRAIRNVLDIYAKLRREGARVPLRIEHVQHLHPADLPRFRELDVIASMQPLHATSDYLVADRLVGKRARYAYAFKSLLDAGAQLIFGSDCPVETLNPIVGIHAAVTRERKNGEPAGGWYPEEKLTVAQAVRAYIATPLTVGALGDAVVLSQDIFKIPPCEILATQMAYTIVGGKIVYAA